MIYGDLWKRSVVAIYGEMDLVDAWTENEWLWWRKGQLGVAGVIGEWVEDKLKVVWYGDGFGEWRKWVKNQA